MNKRFSYDSQCLFENDKPIFPVMGEIHFSRFSEDFWEESLRKMKAGGVTIVSSYVFWIHHEEEEGVFDFSGCRNLRRFVECCKKVGIDLFLRIGPWVHGECRNGGFPDWVVDLQNKGVMIRTNDERYVSYVKRFWQKIYEEIKGLLETDGGPIIGIQIENEYWGNDEVAELSGDAYMNNLLQLAKDIGFDVSLYTATGWGMTYVGDAIPVMGGYCDAPWEQHTEEMPPCNNYLISHIRNDSLIGSDQKRTCSGKYDESKFPFLTAELGGGIQGTAHRRPVITATDTGAMSTAKLAGGVSLLGYYMYHGGSNPKGKFSTLQESRNSPHTNYNDLPEINYDFNAPIRQYGTISDTYKEIKLLALFLKDFGSDLAVMKSVIDPPCTDPCDLHILRRSCRHNEDHGYVFFNNYVRRYDMDEHKNVIFKGITSDGYVEFPAIDIKNKEYGFFPYNMKLSDATLISAFATPLCKLENKNGDTFVFYGDRDPQYCFKDGKKAHILHLSRKDALDAYKIKLDKDYLILNDDFVWQEDGELVIVGGEKTVIRTYPELEKTPCGFEKTGIDGDFSVYERVVESGGELATFVYRNDEDGTKVYDIVISYNDNGEKKAELFLSLDYVGYCMDIYSGEEKINDNFYSGQKVLLRLGYLDNPKKLTVKVKPLKKDDWVYLEKWPQLTDGSACELYSVELSAKYR